jgi:hypothetical protein
MVATNVGALQDYFPADEAAYIPPFNPQALRDAVDQFVASPAEALRQAQAAAAGLLSRDLTTQHYAMQHVRITQEMLQARAQTQPQSKTQAHSQAQAPKQPQQPARAAARESRGGL